MLFFSNQCEPGTSKRQQSDLAKLCLPTNLWQKRADYVVRVSKHFSCLGQISSLGCYTNNCHTETEKVGLSMNMAVSLSSCFYAFQVLCWWFFACPPTDRSGCNPANLHGFLSIPVCLNFCLTVFLSTFLTFWQLVYLACVSSCLSGFPISSKFQIHEDALKQGGCSLGIQLMKRWVGVCLTNYLNTK